MEYSMLIGKPLLSPGGENRGYITGLFLSEDLSRLCSLACADEEEEEFFLPAKAIRSVGDAVIAEGDKIASPIGVPCPVGRAVYDETGGFLGGAGALTDGANGALTIVGAFGEKQIPARQVFAGNCLIVRGGKQRPAKKKPCGKEREPQRSSEPAKPGQSERRRKADAEEMGYRLDLIGKRALKAVEDLIPAGDRVTAETLRRAHENNRLLELASAVLTEA